MSDGLQLERELRHAQIEDLGRMVAADPHRLEQVFVNLLVNAIHGVAARFDSERSSRYLRA